MRSKQSLVNFCEKKRSQIERFDQQKMLGSPKSDTEEFKGTNDLT